MTRLSIAIIRIGGLGVYREPDAAHERQNAPGPVGLQ